jgi:hypothetical protein
MQGIEIKSIFGCFTGVKYPYRKSPDLYTILGEKVFCAQCESEFPIEDWKDHIHSHDKRKGEAELFAIDKSGNRVIITGFSRG